MLKGGGYHQKFSVTVERVNDCNLRFQERAYSIGESSSDRGRRTIRGGLRELSYAPDRSSPLSSLEFGRADRAAIDRIGSNIPRRLMLLLL